MVTTSSRMYKSVAAATLAAVAFSGVGIASATAASAAMHVGPVAVGSYGSTAGAAAGGSTAAGAPVAVSGSAAPVAPGASVSTGIGSAILKALVKAAISSIKKIAGLFKKLVDAVKAGYKAFKKYWDEQVPGWIKAPLTAWSVYDIWSAIKDILGL